MNLLKNTTDIAIIASVVMGPILLFQVYGTVPNYLFYSLLAGWLAYLIAAMAVITKKKSGYLATAILSALILILSLPQPEHYSFFSNGEVYAALTFIIGNLLQIIVLIGSILQLKSRTFS